jgi:pimeloyl-ACP methyl ester carboxylesterase
VVMHSVHCHDRRPDVSREDYERSAAPYPKLSGLFAAGWAHDICRFWQVGSAPPMARAPVTSERPTLILSGAFDPVTPPQWAREVARRFPAARLFEFPGVGHGAVFSDGCATQLAGLFLEDRLEADPPACVARLQGPRFVIDDRHHAAASR